MIVSQRCIDLIKQFEGFYPNAYLCPASVPTIGFGSTMWADGRKVKLGEVISMENAEKLLQWEINNKVHCLNKLRLNQSQFDALMSFVYNVGIGNLMKSTLYKKALLNPNDPTIHDEFMKWNKARVKGVLTPLKGLTRRREAESNLYYDKA
jgi:lysozyme